jgi:hypothetical protein
LGKVSDRIWVKLASEDTRTATEMG